MKKYEAKNPSNARIFINYKDKKRPVRFEYPKKCNTFMLIFSRLLTIWLMINISFLIIIIIIFQVLSINLSISEKAAFFHIFFIPLFATTMFYKKKKFLYLMPEISKKLAMFPLGSMYYKSVKKLNSKIFEIPMFSNIFLDYEATKDFSKYLEKVEIKEWDFKFWKKNIFSKKKVSTQDDIWKARFYFSKIPKNGKLEIWFK